MDARRWKRLAAGAFGFVLAGTAPEARADALVESGERSYQRYCSACHGMTGEGDGPLARLLRVPPADLTRIAARNGGAFPEAEVADRIDGRREVAAHGAREMPVWGRIFSRRVAPDSTAEQVARGEVWVLVEYLKTIQVPAP